MKTKKTDSNGDVNKLLNSVEAQQNIIRNQNRTITELMKELKKRSSYSASKKNSNKMVEAKKKRKTYYDYLVDAIRKVGHPATTEKIALTLSKGNLKFRTMSARKPKSFMQFIYSAVSHLSNKGILTRHSVNDKSYEYGLSEWSTATKKANKR